MIGKLIALVRRKGPIGAARRIASILYWKYVAFRDDTRFDRRYNVDTGGIESAYLANIQSDHLATARYYEASKERDFDKLIGLVPVDRRAVTFIDVGCGKGRVLFYAALAGFDQIVGVEFSDELAEVARRNVENFKRRTSMKASISVLTQDFAAYEFPDTDILLYLYDPFGADVMQIVVDRIVEFTARTRRRVHVAYRNPKCADLFEANPAFETVMSDRFVAAFRTVMRGGDSRAGGPAGRLG